MGGSEEITCFELCGESSLSLTSSVHQQIWHFHYELGICKRAIVSIYYFVSNKWDVGQRFWKFEEEIGNNR